MKGGIKTGRAAYSMINPYLWNFQICAAFSCTSEKVFLKKNNTKSVIQFLYSPGYLYLLSKTLKQSKQLAWDKLMRGVFCGLAILYLIGRSHYLHVSKV